MDILKDLASTGRKIVTDTKTPKQSAVVGKTIQSKAAPEPILTIHQSFVKRAVKDKPPKKELVEFFQRVCDAEERML